MALGLGLGLALGLAPSTGVLVPPSGFGFDFDTYPFKVFGSGRTNLNVESYAQDALNGVAYYVDWSTGSDANNGLSTGARKASVASAITAGNAGGVPYHVIVRNQAGGLVPRAGAFNSGTVKPTQHCAIVAESGPVSFGQFEPLSYSADGSYVGVWVATRTNVARACDLRSTDAYGNPIELTQVATDAEMDGDPGAVGIWYNSGSTFKVKLADGAAVTNDNVMALLKDSLIFLTANKDFYADNLVLYGGHVGSLYASGITGNVMARRVQARLCGASDNLYDGFRIRDAQGFMAFQQCEAYGNAKDAFNGHNSGLTGGQFVLTDRCVGKDNGRFTSQSNNFITSHEDVFWVDAGGLAEDNYGGQVHAIDQSQLWCVGTESRDSKGDTSLGGGRGPTEFVTQQTAQMWLQNTVAHALTSGDYAVRAQDTSTILKRNHVTEQGTEVAEAGATIGAF